MSKLIAGSSKFIAALLFSLLAAQLSAQDFPSPIEKTQAVVDRILEYLRDGSLGEQERLDLIRAEIAPAFDSRAMAQSVLSTNWREANDAQRTEFEELLKQMLESTYIGRLEAYTNESVEYRGEEIRDNRATVETVIVTASNEIPVNYRMRLRSDGWFVYDVVIENVSMVSSYRETYRSVARREGIDGLLQAMRERIAEMNG